MAPNPILLTHGPPLPSCLVGSFVAAIAALGTLCGRVDLCRSTTQVFFVDLKNPIEPTEGRPLCIFLGHHVGSRNPVTDIRAISVGFNAYVRRGMSLL